MSLHILFETSAGYCLFERVQSEEIGQELVEVQNTISDLAKFGKAMKLKSFLPFKSAANALENMVSVAEGVVHDTLKDFLELNLVKSGSKSKLKLGVSDKALAGSIKQTLGFDCVSNEIISELCRGLRLHSAKMIKQFKEGDLDKAQLGLSHSYSRAKVKFNVNRSDNMIIQSIALLDQLDKDLNTFVMRIKEWYSWHFPELARIISDNSKYSKLALAIGEKTTLTIDKKDEINSITEDEGKTEEIFEAAKSSMGTEISEIDLLNIRHFATRVDSLVAYRKNLHEYLTSKMHLIAPNLSALIGEMVGARLISHAGSLTNLSKCPASTVQILGAEKALFRALKTRGKTPKYGLIYHSSFIGKAGSSNKGKVSRYLANKCSIASRIDCFSDHPSFKFGEALKKQMEERLGALETGAIPTSNEVVMKEALKSYEEECQIAVNDSEENDVFSIVSKKRELSQSDEAEESVEKSPKKSKKEKKSKDEKKEKSSKDKSKDKKKRKSTE